jgi:phenylpropionate dioxygenase-like ring-hydroxylating dioxygenase large terminal subunit
MSASLLPQYWYIVAESKEMTQDRVLSREVLEEWLVCYRDESGQAIVAQDRCLHRCARLSCGTVKQGRLTCNYHGWVYGENGHVVSIPVENKSNFKQALQAKTYQVLEQDGYVYVCLEPGNITPRTPRALASLGMNLKGHIRLQNRFQNSLANCVENYIDVPHTAYVHHGIFRNPKGQTLRTTVTREKGEIHITYHGETLNLGSFSWFLNPQGKEILHTDHFYAPNITSVHYHLPNGYRYAITSHSVPVGAMETMVYTDIRYDFGLFTYFAEWLVRRQAQKVIAQDIDILNQQGRTLEKYGARFYPTSADAIHTLTSEIIDSLALGISVDDLSDESLEVLFCV